ALHKKVLGAFERHVDKRCYLLCITTVGEPCLNLRRIHLCLDFAELNGLIEAVQHIHKALIKSYPVVEWIGPAHERKYISFVKRLAKPFKSVLSVAQSRMSSS